MKTIFALLLGVALVTVSLAQKEKKPWTEWSEKEAQKILNDSPWSQVQKDVDTTEMFFQPTADPRTAGARAPNSNTRLEQGATQRIERRIGLATLAGPVVIIVVTRIEQSIRHAVHQLTEVDRRHVEALEFRVTRKLH